MVDGTRSATSTERNPERWAERVEASGHGIIDETPLSTAEEADEMLLMGLRLGEGVDLARLERMTGARPSAAAVAALTRQGLIEAISHADTQRIRATGNGRFILNEIVLRLAMSFAPSPANHPLTRLPPAAE